MNYDSIEGMLNTTDNMEVLRNNSKQDDGTDTVNGVDWFKFNNIVAEKLYANGNCWIGIGDNMEQLKVCRRDGAMWYLYRQEGTLYGFYKFLKLRWEGYTQYNNTTDVAALKFELFLFDTGDMFLNVVQFPTNSSYWGTSALVCGSTTTPLTLDGTSMAISFYHLDDTGSTWDIKYGQLQIDLPFNRRFLLRAPDGILYTETDGSLTALSETNLSAQLFLDSGMLKLPESDLLLSVPDLTILCWQDGGYIPDMSGEIAAVPFNQTIFTDNQDMTHPTITGIESVVVDADENTLFAISFDDGITWKAHNGTAWNVLTEEQSGMTKATLENIGIDAWAEVATTGKYRIRFTLPEGGWVKQIKVNYLNRERADI